MTGDKHNKEVRYLNTLLDSIQDGIIVLDRDLNVIRTNQWVKDRLQHRLDDLHKNCFETLIKHTDPCPGCPARTAFETGEEQTEILENIFPDDDNKHYELKCYPVHDNGGSITQVIEIIRDISHLWEYGQELIAKNQEYETLNEDLRQMNEELLHAKQKAEESDQLKTEFLNNLSHEIRTPMNGIIGFSELLSTDVLEPDKMQHFIDVIQNSSHQLLRMINDILEIATLETRQVEIVNKRVCVNTLISEIVAEYQDKAAEHNLILQFNSALNDIDSTLLTDDDILEKIISKLIDNAIKFTPGGQVTIELKQFRQKLELAVKDTGIGIHPKNKELIFERFSQEDKDISRHYGGLGLGLSIARENAQILKGNIEVESVKDKGSVFRFRFPYVPYHLPVADGKIYEKEQSVPKDGFFKVLIAEDEEINYMYLEAIFHDLEEKGKYQFTLLYAKTGTEVLELLKKHPDVSLILMDLKMPGMTGVDATREIRNQGKPVPIIAQTAYISDSIRNEALASGCDDFISKPIVKKTLQEMIKTYLRV